MKKKRLESRKGFVFLFILLVVFSAGLFFVIHSDNNIASKIKKIGVENINKEAVVLFDHYKKGDPLMEPLDAKNFECIAALGGFRGIFALNRGGGEGQPVVLIGKGDRWSGYNIYIFDPRDENGVPDDFDLGSLVSSNIAVQTWKKRHNKGD